MTYKADSYEKDPEGIIEVESHGIVKEEIVLEGLTFVDDTAKQSPGTRPGELERPTLTSRYTSDTVIYDQRIEDLADYAHCAWSGWMEHLFKQCTHNPDGTVTIPKWAVLRWKRQLNTDYVNLFPSEKESDRTQAQRILGIFGDNNAS